MSRLFGYALAFGVGFGAAKVFRWKPASSGHQHHTPGSDMTVKGYSLERIFFSNEQVVLFFRPSFGYGRSNGCMFLISSINS